MAVKKTKKVTQTDLNLAVNYTIIEKALQRLGILDVICAEHDVLEYVLKYAKDFTLNDRLMAEGKQSPQILEELCAKLQGLFDLDPEVLFGKRQINLGLQIDPQDETAKELAYLSMDQLSDTLIQKGWDQIPWIDDTGTTGSTFGAKEKVDASINNGVGQMLLKRETEAEASECLKQVIYNPLGLNMIGVFSSILRDEVRVANDKDVALEDRVNDIFDDVFNSLSLEEEKAETPHHVKTYHVQKGETYYTSTWQENIYSLDSFLYHYIRAKINGQGKVYTKPEGFETPKMKKYDTLKEISSIMPYPFILTEDSELKQLVDRLFELNYTFSYEETTLIRYANIEDELERYKEELILLQGKIGQKVGSVYAVSQDELGTATTPITAEMQQEYEQYQDMVKREQWIRSQHIPYLEQMEQSFQKDAKLWNQTYIAQCKQDMQNLQNTLSQGSVTKKQRDKVEESLEVIKQYVNKYEIHTTSKNKKISGKNIKPIIIVKEPFYETILKLGSAKL